MRSIIHRSTVLVLALASAGAIAQIPSTNAPRELQALVGRDADEAGEKLRDYGYRYRRAADRGGDRLKYYWDARSNRCVVVAVRDNRVRGVGGASPADCSERAPAQTPSPDKSFGKNPPLPREVTGLVGNKRGDAEAKLASLGFAKVDSKKDDGRTYGYWLNRMSAECLRLEANDGRVRRIERAPKADCR